MYLSGQNEMVPIRTIKSEKVFVKTKEYVWRQYKDYVGLVDPELTI